MSAFIARFGRVALLALVVVLAAGAFPDSAHADAFVVNSLGDGVDANHGDGICQTATPGECTLRAAIEESSHTMPPDTITFSTSGTISPTTDMPEILGTVNIDGTSAPGYAGTPVVTIDGSGILAGPGLGLVQIEANGCTIEGLRLQDFIDGAGVSIYGGDGNHVEDNELLGNAMGVSIIGDSNQNIVSGNTISGNLHGGVATTGPDGQTGNRIEGNTISSNQSPDPDDAFGVSISVTPMNSITAAEIRGNTITGNEGDAIRLSTSIHSGVTGTIIDGNTLSGNGAGIMLDDNGSPDGLFSGTQITNNTLWNTGGIEVRAAEDFVLTNLVLSGNTISGAEHDGIYLSAAGAADASGYVMEDNIITGCGWYGIQIVADLEASVAGTVAGNTITDNTAAGIFVMWWARNITIGPDNVIARNGTLPMPTGIVVANEYTRSITITQNSIYDNDGLGIDLGLEDGVTPNDEGDGDDGPNGLLNYPVITAATLSEVEVYTCGNCTVEVFQADDDGDNGGHGEGRTFLGSYQTGGPTDHWTVPIVGAVECGFVTATVTDSCGNTSEFAANFPLPCPPSSDGHPRPTHTPAPTETPAVTATAVPPAPTAAPPPPAPSGGGALPQVAPPQTGTGAGSGGSGTPAGAWLLGGACLAGLASIFVVRKALARG